MAHTPTLYRMVIVDPATQVSNPFAPGDTTVNAGHFSVDSRRSAATRNYITQPPSDDGDRLDIITGALDDAACQIAISDVSEYITGQLADANARYRLQGREAFIEKSIDAGSSWLLIRHGFVTDIELPRAQEYLITVGGARKKERRTTVARLLRGMPDPSITTHVDNSFYPFYPTAIIGGPVFGGLPGLQDRHVLPLFRVKQRLVSATFGWIIIEHVAGPLPPFFFGTTSERDPSTVGVTYNYQHQGGQTADVEAINTMAAPFFVDSTRLRVPAGAGERARGSFPDLNVYLYDASAPQTLLYTRFAIGSYKDAFGTTITNQSGRNFMQSNKTIFLPWDEDDDGPTPAVDDLFAVAVVPMVMSQEFPLFYAEHPLVVVDYALNAIGRTLDGASAVAARSALGEELHVRGWLTDPKQKVMDWLTQLGAFFGFALVLDDDSTDLKVVLTREHYDGSSLDAITDDDLREIGGPTFKIPSNSQRPRVRATLTQFVQWLSPMNEPRTYSDIVPFEAPFEETADGADDDEAIEFTLPGAPMARLPTSANAPPAPISLVLYVEALSQRLFERHAKGLPEYTFVLTGKSTVNPIVSEFVSMATSHLPNAQSGGASRGGSRPGRLVKRTRSPAGDVLTLIDEGTGVQFDAASLDIASFDASAVQPTSFANLNLDGISSLAGRANVDIYLGLKAAGTTTAPTGRGMLIATEGVDPAEGDTTLIVLGPFPVGVIWWVRIEVWADGFYPSASSAWWNLNGATPTSPPAPPTPTGTISALTISDIGTDYAVLSWTNTNTTEPIRVSYKLDTDSNYTFVAVIPPGSNTYTITSLIPDTDYDFQVELIDTFTQAVHVTLTVSGTTDAGSVTQVLFTPTNPRAYAGQNLLLGVVGLIVSPVFNTTHEVEFEMTPETAVGSGIPDAWPSDVSPALGSETQFWSVTSPADVFSAHLVPNDGRLRFFRARARKVVGGGTVIVSPWTDVYSVMPWTVVVPGGGFGSLIDDGSATTTEIDVVDDGDAATFPAGPPLDGGSATSFP